MYPQEGLLTHIVFLLLGYAISFITWSLIIQAVIGLLLAVNVLDTRNRLVWSLNDFLYRVTEPILRPLRRHIRPFNGVDLTPLLALVLLQAVAVPVLDYLHVGIATGMWPRLV